MTGVPEAPGALAAPTVVSTDSGQYDPATFDSEGNLVCAGRHRGRG